jgi:8-amino-7-oxononanoate synthase
MTPHPDSQALDSVAGESCPLPQGERDIGRGASIVWIGTFSKAAGGYGGYVCGMSEQIERMVNHARSLIYTTGLPPATIASNLAALHIIASDAALTAKPLANARLFDPTAQSAIVPLILGSDEAALAAQQQLEEAGFLVVAIRPPTVPVGTSRLRFAFSAVHREEDIARVKETLKTF